MFSCQGKCFIHYTCNFIHIVIEATKNGSEMQKTRCKLLTNELWDDGGVVV